MANIGHGPNRRRPPDKRTVRWGMHKGKRMGDVPTSYLIWFVQHAYPQMRARRAWAEEELKRRNEFTKEGEF